MPELPEVETVVRELKRRIVGQTIKDVGVLNKRSFQGSPSTRLRPKLRNGQASSGSKKLRGLKIKKISRRGKGIIIELSQDKTLLIHLKMTGQLIYVPTPLRHKGYGGLRRLNLGHPTQDFVNEMPSRHSRVVLKLSRGILYFNDQRLFGWVKVLPTKELANDPFIKKLGPEPISTPYIFSPECPNKCGRIKKDSQELVAHLSRSIQKRPKSSIKAILLDQSVVTGLGNIYSDEVLFEAGVRPNRKNKSITQKDVEKIIKAIKKVLEKSIKYSGTSIVNYKTPEGSPGQMQNYLKVYSRAGLPCQICKSSIVKTRVAGRGTHYCPTCQT